TIVSQGKSTFSILIPVDAPISVQHAAQELQKDIELATDAELPVQKDTAKITSSFISLGSTRQAKIAGISSKNMSVESFHIMTKEGNLYINGPDTHGNEWPPPSQEVAQYLSYIPDTINGDWTKNNGVSDCTANGVYTFLEDYLDVRWLMPGEIGRD